MLKRLLIINLIFVLLLAGVTSTGSAKNLYRNEEYKFIINFPEDWKVERGSDSNPVVVASDTTGSKINICIRETDKNITAYMLSLENVTDRLEALEDIFIDVELLDKSETRIDNNKAMMMEYSATPKGLKNALRMTMRSYSTTNNGHLIVINCGTYLSSYKYHKNAFAESISTLVFEDDIVDRHSVGTTKESQVDYGGFEHSEHFATNSIKQIQPTKGTNDTTNAENKETQKCEMNKPVTGLAQDQGGVTIPEIEDPYGQKVTPVDVEISKALVGTWKETYTQGCIVGESLIIYYGNKTFEEHFTYLAMDDCRYGNGKLLMTGEATSGVRMGTWFVSYGYINYVDDRDIPTSRIKVLSIDKEKASYVWDNGETCEGRRIDLHGDE
jgi:hypothetical protein